MANVPTVLQLVPTDVDMSFDNFIENTIQTLCEELKIESLKYEKTPMAYRLYDNGALCKNLDFDEDADQLDAFQEALEGVLTKF